MSFVIDEKRMTYDAALAVKKTMLKENVENMALYLEECTKEYKDEHPDASGEDIEKAMFDIAYRKIYSEMHMDGTYMWVQKVLDYNGGDGYAVRLIHPNLSDTEGTLLSTNTVNPDGSRAYEKELEGVKKNGSVFIEYDFKKLGSDDISKKVTYSKLYEPLDWIICMGVNIDDLKHYQDQAKLNEGDKITTSAGMGFFDISDNSLADTLARIDEAVYEAKHTGRDRWVAASAKDDGDTQQ